MFCLPGGVAQAIKVTLATSTATMPMDGMPILYACLSEKHAAAQKSVGNDVAAQHGMARHGQGRAG